MITTEWYNLSLENDKYPETSFKCPTFENERGYLIKTIIRSSPERPPLESAVDRKLNLHWICRSTQWTVATHPIHVPEILAVNSYHDAGETMQLGKVTLPNSQARDQKLIPQRKLTPIRCRSFPAFSAKAKVDAPNVLLSVRNALDCDME